MRLQRAARPRSAPLDSGAPRYYAAVTMMRRGCSIFLVAVAAFMVVGHICAAPFHAHAGAVTTHSEDHPERGSDEAAHGGSCEALRTTSDVDAPALLPTGIVLPVIGDLETRHAHTTSAPAPTISPPLFLLHAALLI